MKVIQSVRCLLTRPCLTISQKLQFSYWEDVVKDYFTQKAVLKFTLWKDNQRNEAKPFGLSFLSQLSSLDLTCFLKRSVFLYYRGSFW